MTEQKPTGNKGYFVRVHPEIDAPLVAMAEEKKISVPRLINQILKTRFGKKKLELPVRGSKKGKKQ